MQRSYIGETYVIRFGFSRVWNSMDPKNSKGTSEAVLPIMSYVVHRVTM